MSASAVIKIVHQREHSDCGLACISMYLGSSYEDVLRVVSTLDRHKGKRGLWSNTIKRVAASLGHTLKVRRRIEWDDDYGILRLPDHAVILRNGLIIETNGTVWEADTYLRNRVIERDECELFVCED